MRNALHYANRVFDHADWTERGAYMRERHGIEPEVAEDALSDPNRVLVNPDYNSRSGQTVRVIGYSTIADDVITVILLPRDGSVYGVNGWSANEKDRRIYSEVGMSGSEGATDDEEA